ncbi:MAG TPA: CHAD domain-containing protein, partial [Acidimicrobiales bacterium]|nr:CHAD domain-containing protein [Acidimicrobiales bacterium]
RRAAHRRLVDAMDERRYLALVEHLRAAVDEPPFADPRSGSVPSWIEPSAPAVQALRPLVRRPWRRVARAVQRLGDPPTDEELHKLRIRAKQLRYAAELAAPVVGRRAAALAAAAEDLQTVLGDQHDAVAAELWLRETAAAGTTAQVFAAGQAVAHERRRQAAGREAWPAAWRALRRKKLRGWTRR